MRKRVCQGIGYFFTEMIILNYEFGGNLSKPRHASFIRLCSCCFHYHTYSGYPGWLISVNPFVWITEVSYEIRGLFKVAAFVWSSAWHLRTKVTHPISDSAFILAPFLGSVWTPKIYWHPRSGHLKFISTPVGHLIFLCTRVSKTTLLAFYVSFFQRTSTYSVALLTTRLRKWKSYRTDLKWTSLS
jgi:hypothetical protein